MYQMDEELKDVKQFISGKFEVYKDEQLINVEWINVTQTFLWILFEIHSRFQICLMLPFFFF